MSTSKPDSSFGLQGRPIPSINRPKEIFDLLFVTQGREIRDKLSRSKSALDLLFHNVHALSRKLSSHDRETLEQYLDSVRDTELKLLKAEQWIDTAFPEVDANHLNLEVTVRESRSYIQTIAEDTVWQSDPDHHELPLAHLFVTILKRMGIETDEFAGYKGGLDRV